MLESMDLQEIDVVNQRELMEAVNLDEESTQRVLHGPGLSSSALCQV